MGQSELKVSIKRRGQRWAFLSSATLIFFLCSSNLHLPRESTALINVAEAADLDETCSEMMGSSSANLPVPAGGDILPVRSVWDPYPSLHSIAVDTTNNQVVMTDSNRGSLLFYGRTSGNGSAEMVTPQRQVRGPATGMMFIAGVALDPAEREVFAVNNDIGDRMEVFSYEADGNAKPKRVLFVPHGSWGISLDKERGEVAISVEHIHSVVVYRRDATNGDAPLRVIRGAQTGLADPHGIAFDVTNHEILVANHGNWAPLTSEEASAGNQLRGGHFQPPSIITLPAAAQGDAAPTRSIQGERTQLNWPMGIAVDTAHNEVAVANYGNNSILIFRKTDTGDVAPVRMIQGDQTGILAPMGVAIDIKNDELWVTNYRDHSAVVFPRDAQGNVTPKRILRNAPAGTPAVGFGNPGAVAYDTKRREILVPN